MSADLVDVIAAVIAENSEEIFSGEHDWVVALTLTPDDMARAVLVALEQAGQVEWGVSGGSGRVLPRKSRQSAKYQIAVWGAGKLHQRVTLPWRAVEG